MAWASLWLGGGILIAIPLVAVFGRLPGVAADASATTLRTLVGVLEHCGGQYCVGDSVVDFGPPWYLEGTQARHDFDGDGRTGMIREEVEGQIGSTVTLETDGGALDEDVFTIDGLPFRDAKGQLPPPPGRVGR